MGVLDRFSLAGRTALVTGAGQGIGQAFALALAEAGADVAVVDVNVEGARAVAAEAEGLGVRALAIHADISRPDDVNSMVAEILTAWGHLEVAVNNAGVRAWAPAEEMTRDAWERVLGVNLTGTFLCAQAEAQAMLPRGYGKIINMASMSAHVVNRPQTQVGYNVSKAGVVHLTRTLAAEWASRGVRVNSISPGYTRTPLTAKLGGLQADWLERIPLGRMGEVDDLQGAVVYLASEASDYMTGHDLVIDGGYTLW